LTKRLRGWVARDLQLSERWVKELEEKENKKKIK
jgi:hypothetical protein